MANKDDIQLNIGVSQASLKKMQKEVKGVYNSLSTLTKDLAAAEKAKNAAAISSLNTQIKAQKELHATVRKGLDDENKKLKVLKEQEKALEKQVTLGKRLAKGAVAGAGRAANVGLGVARNAGRLGMSAAGSVGGFLVGAMQAGYAKYSEHQQALGGTIGLASTSRLRNAAYGSGGTRYGYNKTDVAGMIPAMGRATGNVSPLEMMQANRASGMDLGEVAGRFGALRQSGLSFEKSGKGPSSGAKEFEKLMAGGVKSGIEKSRLHEYFDSVEKIAGTAGGMSVGNISHSKIGQTLSMWGMSGQSGMQGARGGALMSKVLGGIMSPGGGEAGESLMNQAFGFGKPGGTASYYEAMKARQGIHKNPENIQKVMSEITSQYGSGQEGSMATSNALGISLEQSETLLKIYESDKTVIEKQEAIKKVMDEAKSIDEQSLEAMKGLGGHLQRLAGIWDRGINFGAKSAEMIEAIQDASIDAAEWLQKHIFPVLKEIWNTLKDLYQWFTSTATKEAKDAYLSHLKTTNKAPSQFKTIDEYLKYSDQAGLARVAGLAAESAKHSSGDIASIQAGGGAGFVKEALGSLKQIFTGSGMDISGHEIQAQMQLRGLGTDVLKGTEGLPENIRKQYGDRIKASVDAANLSADEQNMLKNQSFMSGSTDFKTKYETEKFNAALNAVLEVASEIRQMRSLNSDSNIPQVKVEVTAKSGTKAKVIGGPGAVRKNAASSEEE